MKQAMPDRKKMIGIITMALVVVCALTIGFSVYSAPGNQLSRQLDLGHKYLEEGQYADAVLAFENAILIDEKCLEAYQGGIEAYLLVEDREALLAFYDKALTVVENSGEEVSEQNREIVEDIYLAAGRVYSDEPERRVEILKKGWAVTKSPKLKENLIEGYLIIVEGKIEEGDYESGLEILDRVLELAADAGSVREILEKCLTGYLERLMEEKNYDEIRTLAKKYGQLVPGLDFDTILRQLEEKEALERENAFRKEETEEEYDEVSEGDEETEVEMEDALTGVQGDNAWVDDLYQKIIAEDADGVFSIMEQPDFIEKCEEFPHCIASWDVDYSLLTSNGGIFWVVKDINDGDLYITCTPGDRASDYEVGGWVEEGREYTYYKEDGRKDWVKGLWGIFHT